MLEKIDYKSFINNFASKRAKNEILIKKIIDINLILYLMKKKKSPNLRFGLSPQKVWDAPDPKYNQPSTHPHHHYKSNPRRTKIQSHRLYFWVFF